jgi:hypothetical protein
VRGVTRKAMRERILQRAGWYLGGDETVVGVARVWATDVRGKVPLLFRQRSFYDFVVTDQRVVLLARPRRVRAPWRRHRTAPEGPLVAKRHPAFTIMHVRRGAILLQVRLRYSGESDLVLEFRPLDRALAGELVDRIRRASQAQQAA